MLCFQMVACSLELSYVPRKLNLSSLPSIDALVVLVLTSLILTSFADITLVICFVLSLFALDHCMKSKLNCVHC